MSKRRSKISRKLSQLPKGLRNRIIGQDNGYKYNHVSDLFYSVSSFSDWNDTTEGPYFWGDISSVVINQGYITNKQYNNIKQDHGITGL